jgi:hypothetical protein
MLVSFWMMLKRRRRIPTMIYMLTRAMTWVSCWNVAVAAAEEEVDLVTGKYFNQLLTL